MSVSNFKQSLLNAPWPLVERVQVESDKGPVELLVRRPPDKVVAELLTAATEAGLREGNDANVSPAAALLFQARVIATTVFEPNAVRPLFTEAEVQEWPQAGVVRDACLRAVFPPAAAVERAKGN